MLKNEPAAPLSPEVQEEPKPEIVVCCVPMVHLSFVGVMKAQEEPKLEIAVCFCPYGARSVRLPLLWCIQASWGGIPPSESHLVHGWGAISEWCAGADVFPPPFPLRVS